jgi:predicted amidophosphoribosyltransferase
MLISATNSLIRIMLAPACAACEAELERPLSGPVCDACWIAVPRLTMPCCERCGDALADWRAAHRLCPRCRRRPPLLESALSAGRYDGSLRQIVHAFKYQRRRVLAAPLAAMMRTAGADLLNRADAVVPVPLHPWRAFHRGFNQADDLARRLELPVVKALRRRVGGPPQASLPAAQRHGNVRDAFVLRPLIRLSQNDLGGRFTNFVKRPPRSFLIRNRSLVLIDDVMTTGATLDACARQLLDAGARSVSALTVARAVAGQPARRQPTPRPSDARHR